MGRVFNMTGGGGGGIKLDSIAIISGPTRTEYTAGETFDPAGMVIEATYTNGATVIATGFDFTPSTPLTDGTDKVTIRYTEGGVTKTADVPITVIHRLTGLRVTTQPSKLVYEYGESFSTAGMVVTAEYSDGYTETVTGYTYSPTGAFSSLGGQTVTITYSDGKHTVSTTLTVTVERQTISAVPAQSGTLTYTGAAQSPSWTGYDSAKMTLGGVTSGTDVGSYSAEFTPTANYRWSDGTTTAKTVQWTIAKATISAVPSQSGTLTYTGTEQSPVWSGYDSAKMTIDGTQTGINAGSYSVTFTPKANYQWSDGTQSAKTATWTIGKAAGSVTVSPTSLSLTASATTGTITVTRTGDGAITATSNATGVATVSVSGNVVTVTGVATGNATVTVNVAEGTNHLAASVTVSVSVTFYVPDYGTIWTITESGTWTVPVTGTYDLELHGGGGGGGRSDATFTDDNVISSLRGGGGGGGSGELFAGVPLTGGDVINVVIGAGGVRGSGGVTSQNGGATTFGSYTVEGGRRGLTPAGGSGRGSIAEAGTASTTINASTGSVRGGGGGDGNINNRSQRYGDGGSGGSESSTDGTTASGYLGSNGQPGAVIITYKGT